MDHAAEIEARLSAAVPVVEEAGRLALEHFRQPLIVDNKRGDGAFDPVTVADRGVEAVIREGLSQLYPDSPIFGEEQGFTPGDSDWTWVIDPIDGTRAFISGMPVWGILLGLTKDGAAAGGIMHQPYTDELFVGSPAGAFLHRGGTRTRLHASGRSELDEAILYATHPEALGPAAAGFARVSSVARMTRFGGDCYAYCLLAHGQIDLVIEGVLQPYDIVPLIPIIEAAGGVVTDLDGNSPLDGGIVVAAANPTLHARALAMMLED